jgi:endonuclease G
MADNETKELLKNILSQVTELKERVVQLEKVGVNDADKPGKLLKIRDSKVDPGVEDTHERVVGSADFLPIHFLLEGAHRQRAVCRISQPEFVATGFLIAPSIVLTNNHVIATVSEATTSTLQFNYQDTFDGSPAIRDDWRLDPSRVFYTNVALDFTIVAVRPQKRGEATVTAGSIWGTIPLPPGPLQFAIGTQMNIIQHPAGRKKEVALHNNTIDKIFSNVIRYKTDSEEGSSGSPVFNNAWDLVALHHAGGDQSAQGAWLNNEGIRGDRIVQTLRAQFPQTTILQELGL